MTRRLRRDGSSPPLVQAGGGGFVVRPRWRLIFQDQEVDESVTMARDDARGNVRRLIPSKQRLTILLRRATDPLRRAG